MDKLNKVFVVMNPNAEEQLALTRGAEIAHRLGSILHAHLCFFTEAGEEKEDIKQQEIENRRTWVENHLETVKQLGVTVEYAITWGKDWQEEIGKAASQIKPDLIVKALKRNPESSRKLQLLSSDWSLFDTAVCPVLLVNPGTVPTGKILAAIDINREDEKYQEIMDLVLARAHNVAESRNAELHVVNSFNDSMNFVHITDVAKKANVQNENVHIEDGKPEEVIVEVAEKINAELVLLGISAKHKITTRIFGYTSEWLLNNLSQDVMVIVPNKSD